MNIRVYIGTSRISKTKGAFALGYFIDKQYTNMPVQVIEKNNIDLHYINLMAIRYFLEAIKSNNKPDLSLTFYVVDDTIPFEWNREFLEDKKFCRQTKDQNVWKDIIQIITDKNISINIKESDNVLTALSKRERGRIKR